MSSSEAAAGLGSRKSKRKVGLIYDERMCRHRTPDDEPHPENPDRIRAIWNKLQSSGIAQRCVIFKAEEAEDEHILLVHGKHHANFIKKVSSKQYDSQRKRMALKLDKNSVYLNEGSSQAAYLAAGSVIQVTEQVAKGELSSAFAIIRPPGHHAEQNEAMGFCLFNNVAIAASYILNEKPALGIKKILIVDWDVHHGNGTQKMFWKDPRVLFFSVHRHEFGTFYPGNDDGDYTMTGEGPGAGYNINVPWENARCGDADYLAVWDHILMPVAKEFNPDMIIISAGFDAAIGDPLGGCRVTPYGYSMMLKKLLDFAEGKIVLALEGGYNFTSTANSALACMEILLDDEPSARAAEAYPFESTWRVIKAVRQELKSFWPSLSQELPRKLTSQIATLLDEDEEVAHISSDPSKEILQDVIQPSSIVEVDGSDNACLKGYRFLRGNPQGAGHSTPGATATCHLPSASPHIAGVGESSSLSGMAVHSRSGKHAEYAVPEPCVIVLEKDDLLSCGSMARGLCETGGNEEVPPHGPQEEEEKWSCQAQERLAEVVRLLTVGRGKLEAAKKEARDALQALDEARDRQKKAEEKADLHWRELETMKNTMSIAEMSAVRELGLLRAELEETRAKFARQKEELDLLRLELERSNHSTLVEEEDHPYMQWYEGMIAKSVSHLMDEFKETKVDRTAIEEYFREYMLCFAELIAKDLAKHCPELDITTLPAMWPYGLRKGLMKPLTRHYRPYPILLPYPPHTPPDHSFLNRFVALACQSSSS